MGGQRHFPEDLSENQIKLRAVLVSQKYLVITIFKLQPLITSLLQRNSVYSVVSFTISLLSYQILVGT